MLFCKDKGTKVVGTPITVPRPGVLPVEHLLGTILFEMLEKIIVLYYKLREPILSTRDRKVFILILVTLVENN